MLYVHGVGHAHPANIITNKFLEELDIGTSGDWILERVGIRERRTVMSIDYIRNTKNNPALAHGSHIEISNVQLASQAAHMALKHAGIEPKDIGLVWAGSCSPQYLIPAESSILANELGIQAFCYDIHSACSTFSTMIYNLMAMSPEFLPDYILISICDTSTRSVNFFDRSSAVLWGDAASVLILSKKHWAPMKILGSYACSDPCGWNKVVIPTGSHFAQEGQAVQRFAIKKTIEGLRNISEKYEKKIEDCYFIGHQANFMMLKSVCKTLQIPDEKHLYNVDAFGNCGAAGAPSVLSQHFHKFHPGDTILLSAVGSGLTWGSMAIEIQKQK